MLLVSGVQCWLVAAAFKLNLSRQYLRFSLERESEAIRHIVRIEFSPVVEISASNGQNLLQETTYVGLALSHV